MWTAVGTDSGDERITQRMVMQDMKHGKEKGKHWKERSEEDGGTMDGNQIRQRTSIFRRTTS